MAHIDHEEQIRRDLTAHRDHIQALLNRLGHGLSCAELLGEVHECRRALGELCAELAIEHLKHHIAEEHDAGKRDQGATEVAVLLRDLFK